MNHAAAELLVRPALDRVFSPHSIAVIGASSDPSKRGNQAIRALRDSGYEFPVHGVNPRGGSAHGVVFALAVEELPYGIDLALVSLPARLVPDVLRQLAERQVAGAVVLANGFGELGTAEAREIDHQLRVAIGDTGIRVIGPNTSGMLNVPMGANLVGVPGVPSGPISVVTQSGNMLLSLIADNAEHHGPGFASYVGLGNQADLRYDECLEYLSGDPATGAIALHSEGLLEGRRFLQAAVRASAKRPVVMLRGGRSEVGQRSALSHTGSIAGADDVAVAVLAQAGVELVDRSDELAVVTGVLATTPPVPYGTGVAILSDGGGHATLAADSLTARGVPLATLTVATTAQLTDALGEAASVQNPVDVAGATDADPTKFADAVEALLSDEGVGLVLVIGLFGGYHIRFDPGLVEPENRTAERLLASVETRGKALLVQSCYAGHLVDNHDILRTGGVQVLSSIDHAARSVESLVRRGRRLATADARSDLMLPPPLSMPENVPVGLLDEPSARRLIESHGIDLGPWSFVVDATGLDEALVTYGAPCAVKVVSAQVVHKSDAGGVLLGVTAGLGEGQRTWTDLAGAVTSAVPTAVIDGTVVTPMAQTGAELLVGATHDPIFGPVVAFGSGGLMVEALRDVSFRAAPFTALEAAEMIEETIASRLLDGYRSILAVDREALVQFLVAVGDLMASCPEISELDLNPVIARGARITPVDVRVVLAHGPTTSKEE